VSDLVGWVVLLERQSENPMTIITPDFSDRLTYAVTDAVT
jgi:hypothetical protein